MRSISKDYSFWRLGSCSPKCSLSPFIYITWYI